MSTVPIDLERLAHQLRNPVTVIRTLAHLVYKRLEATDPNRPLLAAIEQECARLDDLLDLNSYTFELQIIDLHNLLTTLVEKWKLIAQQQECLFEARLTALPLVCSNAPALQEILTNLLDNAIKYTPAGGQISLSSFVIPEQPDWCCISIADTGTGIADPDLARIFEPYYRGNQTVSSAGQGLGLAIVRDLTGRIGARIEMCSAPGDGSVFTLYIPVAPSEQSLAMGE